MVSLHNMVIWSDGYNTSLIVYHFLDDCIHKSPLFSPPPLGVIDSLGLKLGCDVSKFIDPSNSNSTFRLNKAKFN